ncbi:hypothetical protein Tsubulata_013767 [Turnera subulata]|uniref:Uncharacterized protein n=1 Tax=Turnera subulata TaxID=218843 RepID=A0A9Q0FCB0_9ROSI|nr:hypothetical protein Tsubulata_013767 [Turnera subulata]
MAGVQVFKRFPRKLINFPQRRQASAAQSQEVPAAGNADVTFFSNSKGSSTLGGKASLQPKRTPVSNEEIEAILDDRVNVVLADPLTSHSVIWMQVDLTSGLVIMTWVAASENFNRVGIPAHGP